VDAIKDPAEAVLSLPPAAKFKSWKGTHMNIVDNLMQSRSAFTAQIEAIPLGQSIDEVFGARWAIEQTILSCKATTLDAIKQQIRILAGRAAAEMTVRFLARGGCPRGRATTRNLFPAPDTPWLGGLELLTKRLLPRHE
jgi:hypothetical protein